MSADELFAAAVPDPENTLGGVKGDTDPPHPNVIVAIVKSLMPGQDLTRVTIPPFYLEPRSLLERWSDVLMHPQLLHGVCRLESPEERMLAVTRWFLSGWHYRTLGVKKPFNPIVGETFACYWKDPDGSTTQYLAEQVLHRPPISAVYFENKEHCYRANAHIWTKGTFQVPQSSKSALDGGCILTLTNLDEEYWISFPSFYAHNLLLGALRMEVGDTGVIVCKKTGLRAEIAFNQIGMFSSSTLNSVSGRVFVEAGGRKIASIKGHWDKVLFLSREGGAGAAASAAPSSPSSSSAAAASSSASASAEAPWLDLTSIPVLPKYVLPLDAQGPWESRRLWRYCAEELGQRPEVNWAAVDREKLHLEEEQRLLPCHGKVGTPAFKEWEPKLFKPRKVMDPVTGKERSMHFFVGGKEGEPLSVLALSRSLPDVRGGLGDAGSDPAMTALTRSIKISTRRLAERSAALGGDAAGGGAVAVAGDSSGGARAAGGDAGVGSGGAAPP